MNFGLGDADELSSIYAFEYFDIYASVLAHRDIELINVHLLR